jgi:hypothetical protein
MASALRLARLESMDSSFRRSTIDWRQFSVWPESRAMASSTASTSTCAASAAVVT